MNYEPFLGMNLLISQDFLPYFNVVVGTLIGLTISFVIIQILFFYALFKRAYNGKAN